MSNYRNKELDTEAQGIHSARLNAELGQFNIHSTVQVFRIDRKTGALSAERISLEEFALDYWPTDEAETLARPAKPQPSHAGIIQTSREWVASWRPPKYLITDILQQRFFYILTAPAGTGKTAIALTLAAHVGLGKRLGDHSVKQGRVLYLAGENPDDAKTRWLLMAEQMDFDPKTIPVDIVEGVRSLGEVRIAARDEYSLVIVDTDQAYFDGEDMNGNSERKEWAQKLRTLVKLPGGPSVVVLSHPPKDARTPPFRPYGGNAFLNEADANIFLVRDGNFILFKRDPLKFRGPEFAPVPFSLQDVTSIELHSEPVSHIMAIPMAREDYEARKAKTVDRDTELMALLNDEPGLSLEKIAKSLGGDWTKNKVRNRLEKHLAKRNFVEQDASKKWKVTVQGARAFKLETKLVGPESERGA